MQNWGDGVYIVGLDYHTGFILVSGRQVSLIHASGYPPFCVVKEPLQHSFSIKKSSCFVVGKISADHRLMDRWVKRQRIPTSG